MPDRPSSFDARWGWVTPVGARGCPFPGRVIDHDRLVMTHDAPGRETLSPALPEKRPRTSRVLARREEPAGVEHAADPQTPTFPRSAFLVLQAAFCAGLTCRCSTPSRLHTLSST